MGDVQPEYTQEKQLVSYVNLLHEDQTAIYDTAVKVSCPYYRGRRNAYVSEVLVCPKRAE